MIRDHIKLSDDVTDYFLRLSASLGGLTYFFSFFLCGLLSYFIVEFSMGV